MDETNRNCVVGAKLTERVNGLESIMEKFDKTVNKIDIRLDELREGWQKRPSWTVTILLTILTSSTTGLLVTLLKKI